MHLSFRDGNTRSGAMRSSGAAAVVAVLVLLFLPLLYVLSIGPAVWLHDRGMMSPTVTQCAQTIYSPLEWAAFKSSVTMQIMEGYLNWWRRPQPFAPAVPLPPPAPTPAAPTTSPGTAPTEETDPALSTPDDCR